MGVTGTHDDTRATLEQERTQLARRVDELTAGGQVDDLEFDADFADRGQVAGEQGENLTLADSLQNQLNLVEKALTRIDDGTYGTCEICGKDINPERLEAMPAAGLCIDHA
ncbi:MAG: dksa/trar family transcriptional regulator [Actinomycetia bacterium]|nr:dksa/trar family transcriptional regulator [Actinomycetes bacterium]MCP4087300.1 dksa/trar family transcriptional regulator [Actinomycetes bacterium]